MCAPTDVAAMRDACSGRFTAVAFDDAGHTPRRETRDSYLSAVLTWLAGITHAPSHTTLPTPTITKGTP